VRTQDGLKRTGLGADSSLATDVAYSAGLDDLSLGTNFKATPLMQ